MAMKIHLEVQQREDIRPDLAEGIKFVPPDLRAREQVFYWQADLNKIKQGRKSGRWLKVEIIAVQGPHGCFQYRCYHISGKHKQAEETVDTGIWKIFRDSRDRARAPVLWLSCEGQLDIWEMFSDNLSLTGKDSQVAAPIDLRTKKAESFSSTG